MSEPIYRVSISVENHSEDGGLGPIVLDGRVEFTSNRLDVALEGAFGAFSVRIPRPCQVLAQMVCDMDDRCLFVYGGCGKRELANFIKTANALVSFWKELDDAHEERAG